MPESTTTTFRISQEAAELVNGDAINGAVIAAKLSEEGFGGMAVGKSAGMAIHSSGGSAMSRSSSSYHHSSSASSITSGHSHSTANTVIASSPIVVSESYSIRGGAIENGGSYSMRSEGGSYALRGAESGHSLRENGSSFTAHRIESNGTSGGSFRMIETEIPSRTTVTEIHQVSVSGAKELYTEATLKEKEEMQRLNDCLSDYIARVKQLEEQNRALVASLSEMSGKWRSKNETYRSSYFSSVSAVRDDRLAACKTRFDKDVQLTRLSTDIADYRARTDEIYRLAESDRQRVPQWRSLIAEADTELNILHKRFEDLKIEEKMSWKEQDRLRQDLAGLYQQLDVVTAEKLSYQSQVQCIRDEIKFYKSVHEEETRELNSLLVMAPADTREFFRNEIALAVRDIRREFQMLASVGKVQLESWYKSKINTTQELVSRRGDSKAVYFEQVKKMSSTMSELNTKYSQIEGRNHSLEMEVQKLQMQVDQDHRSYEKTMSEYDVMVIRMREEYATLVAELQSLLDSKVILDGEIAIYRAMVEGEKKRVGVVVVKVDQEHSDQWEVATKTKFNTVAHGNVAITQSDPTGRFIVVSNNSDYIEERIGGWRIKRVIDNDREMIYVFPSGFTIKPRQKIRIFASGQGGGPDSLTFAEEKSWGMGANITTTLYDATGKEKAVYTQTTVHSSA